MEGIIFGKASREIEKYLKNNRTITFSKAKDIISKLKVSVFWSRKVIITRDLERYTNVILNSMVNKDKSLYYEYGTYRVYKLK